MALSLRDGCEAARLKLAARLSDDADRVRRLLALAAIYDGASGPGHPTVQQPSNHCVRVEVCFTSRLASFGNFADLNRRVSLHRCLP